MSESLPFVYLDNAATTRCSDAAAGEVQRGLTDCFGNPSSLHKLGLLAARELTRCREAVKAAVGGEDRGTLLFCSGATEANNLALLGAARALRRRGNKILSSKGEHHSVLHALEALEKEGFSVTLLPLRGGVVDPQEAAAATDGDTILASFMRVNSETGAINDIPAISRGLRQKNPSIVLHCDGVQALGKQPLSARGLGVELLSVSSHKIQGPKGVGALYMAPGVRVLPQTFGGGQEGSLRPGTENLPGILGFAKAAGDITAALPQNSQQVEILSRRLVEKLSDIEGFCSNSPPTGTPYIQNLSFLGLKSEVVLHFLAERGVYLSAGSACAKGAKSHVLTAMGLSPQRIDSALRLSLSPQLTQKDIDYAADCIHEAANTLLRL